MLLIQAHVVDLDVRACDPGTEVTMTFDLCRRRSSVAASNDLGRGVDDAERKRRRRGEFSRAVVVWAW